MIRRPPRSTFSPTRPSPDPPAKKEPFARLALNYVGADAQADGFYQKAINDRSEEHTSELQSLAYLVCRLLLEKKKAQPDRPACSDSPADWHAAKPHPFGRWQ